jgi:dihydrofolate reductase
MRKVRYVVASSLDGFIAGPKGEADWIIMDPEIDFQALFAQFDTILVGRRSFEAMGGQSGTMPGMKTYVFSRTLKQRDDKKVTVVGGQTKQTVTALREGKGKDIWLFGGGSLFRSLADEGLVDTVEVAVIPVVLGGVTPLVAGPYRPAGLRLTGHKVYKSGIVSLGYDVEK